MCVCVLVLTFTCVNFSAGKKVGGEHAVETEQQHDHYSHCARRKNDSLCNAALTAKERGKANDTSQHFAI